jgi:hypothetical protein
MHARDRSHHQAVVKTHLEQLVLKSHVRLWLQSNAGAEDVGERSTLLSEGVDNWSARRGKGGLLMLVYDFGNPPKLEKLTLSM